MVSVGISEFTFGFGFLFEQTRKNWDDLRAVPVLPSLRNESEEGWDAHLPLSGTDFYYQFKLSDYLVNHNAKYIKDKTYSDPYYRITLHRRNFNQQHRRLKLHSAIHPNTYYVAPEFFEVDDFQSAFRTSQVAENSRLFPLRDCKELGDRDDEPHYITFQTGHSNWMFHSRKERHEKSYMGKELGDIYRASRKSWQPINQDFANSLLGRATEGAQKILQVEKGQLTQPNTEEIDFREAQESTWGTLLRASNILSSAYGLALVIVGDHR